MYKFQSSTCKTVGEKLWTKLCPQTDGRTDGQPWQFHFVVGVITIYELDDSIDHRC